MRRYPVFACVVALLALALFPVTAWAEDVPVPGMGPPPSMPPAPPPPMVAGETAPVMVTEMPMAPVPCEAPRMYERQGFTPQPQMVVTGPICCISRDDCGWPLAPSGCRYGRVVVWAEGMWSFTKAPEGIMGEPPYIAGPIANPDPIEWDALDYGDGEFGFRGTIRYAVAPETWLELRGTYYGKFDDTQRDAGQFGFLPGNLGTGGVIAPNATDLYSESEIYGGELNFWTEVACTGSTSWSLGLGAHWVQFDEGVTASNWATPFAPFTTPPYMQSDVENQYIAAQLGASARWEITPCFDVTLMLKGMLGNMNRKITVRDNSVFSGGSHFASSEKDEIVAGVDFDLSLRWRLTRWIALTAGYNMLFVDNVVRAHDAMDFTQSNSGAIQPVHATDQLLVHSILVGLQFQF